MFFSPIKINTNKIILHKIARIRSHWFAIPNGNGLITALIQSTNKILNIFDQITFQIAISVFFLYAAMADVASSGNQVQIAIIVSQIIDSLNQKCWAM